MYDTLYISMSQEGLLDGPLVQEVHLVEGTLLPCQLLHPGRAGQRGQRDCLFCETRDFLQLKYIRKVFFYWLLLSPCIITSEVTLDSQSCQ